MQLIDFLTVSGNMIVEGNKSILPWEVYPLGTRYIDVETDAGFSTANFNPKTGEIYDVYVCDRLGKEYNYRWVNKVHEKTLKDYLKTVQKEEDDFRWSFTDSEKDILEKIEAILNNRSFNTDVIMDFDIDDDTMTSIEKIALERKITIDELLVEALRKIVEEPNEIANT